jgi:hypothetical protein
VRDNKTLASLGEKKERTSFIKIYANTFSTEKLKGFIGDPGQITGTLI